ncbi:MAG TPA: hypothetical protein PK079_25310 [Leptospiraceae bacterium]|nr:hypothetical protein [Leptospiraceae bacterium]HMY34405.1 hypothetical protein [Leptospiraceae bacterium]HNC01528.1 hypothetical protein [Leptospiraceae bacterium]HNC59610.1 hypothetical protein [Leptospiraceae bacterium]HNE11493.1 hypothetical protein [Leptospiraceae bacterium]
MSMILISSLALQINGGMSSGMPDLVRIMCRKNLDLNTVYRY